MEEAKNKINQRAGCAPRSRWGEEVEEEEEDARGVESEL